MARPKLELREQRKKLTVGYNGAERGAVDSASRRAGSTRARFIREASLYCAGLINAAEQGSPAPSWPFGAPDPIKATAATDEGNGSP